MDQRLQGPAGAAPPDWRGLCEELANYLQGRKDREYGWPGEDPEQDLLDRVQSLLAQPEPEVVGPTDGSGKEWQWYTYCPEEGIELYPDSQQAQSAAQSIMGSYEVAAHSDGWHEDMELVSWGMLVPVEQAQVVDRGPADPDREFDEWVRYELRAVARWGRPAPAPAGEVERAASVRRMCDIILGSTFGNEELDSLALLVGHHPDVLNVSPASVREIGELAVNLRHCSDALRTYGMTGGADCCTRAADLLEQRQAAPVPADRTLSPEQPSPNQQALEMLDSFACSMETLGMDTDIFYRALKSSPAPAPAGAGEHD